MSCPATLIAAFWLAIGSAKVGWSPDARAYWRGELLGYSVQNELHEEIGFSGTLTIEIPCDGKTHTYSVKGYNTSGQDTPWYGWSQPIRCVEAVPTYEPDTNGDCVVGTADFDAFRAVYGLPSDRFDADGSGGHIGLADFNAFRLVYGGQLR